MGLGEFGVTDICLDDCVAHIAELAEGELRRLATKTNGYPWPDIKAKARRDLAIYKAILNIIGPPGAGEITFTSKETGELVAITKTDDEHRVLTAVWMRP